MKPATAAEKNT